MTPHLPLTVVAAGPPTPTETSVSESGRSLSVVEREMIEKALANTANARQTVTRRQRLPADWN